ncbi:unnamed protein product [Euphydryas editha]|uniref:DUF659 domain-containing protein n=1 Tax=Euphydryas editha TaxID=104508 RepID=A0AAU9TZF5_EUPED|nr:unnamed protein product [Euphydryas editha]
MPKPLHLVWADFQLIAKPNNTGKWAKCKHCAKEMQGIPERMVKHRDICIRARNSNSTTHPNSESTSRTRPTSTSCIVEVESKNKKQTSIKDKIISTSTTLSKQLDTKIAAFFYATNTPFSHADHSLFKEMITALRPGYKPPSAFQLAGPLLNETYAFTVEKDQEYLRGKTVSMSLDGWSNIHNEPIVCCSITTGEGDSVLVHTVDTSGNSHSAEYLTTVAKQSIKKTEEYFRVKVRSFVTDNTGNVTKMRRELEMQEDIDIIQYGCSAHFLNLLAEDVEVKEVTKHVINVVKYFRNKHLPAAWYKGAKGKKLVMPIGVRWNSIRDTVRSFVENRGILVQICQNHRDAIDRDIYRIVNDIQIANNSLDLLARLDPIAKALDRSQRDGTTISVAVEIWNYLEKDLTSQPTEVISAFKKRRDMALGAPHYLANILDHRFAGKNLTPEQRNTAFTELEINFMSMVTSIMTQSLIFPQYLFGSQFQTTPPLDWWKLLNLNTTDVRWEQWEHKKRFLNMCEQLLTAVASTAGLERTFSSFGLVQSKLRNRLGTEKANKLVYLLKRLNKSSVRKRNLDWISDPTHDDHITQPADAVNDIQNVVDVRTLTDRSSPDSESEDDLPLSSVQSNQAQF